MYIRKVRKLTCIFFFWHSLEIKSLDVQLEVAPLLGGQLQAPDHGVWSTAQDSDGGAVGQGFRVDEYLRDVGSSFGKGDARVCNASPAHISGSAVDGDFQHRVAVQQRVAALGVEQCSQGICRAAMRAADHRILENGIDKVVFARTPQQFDLLNRPAAAVLVQQRIDDRFEGGDANSAVGWRKGKWMIKLAKNESE